MPDYANVKNAHIVPRMYLERWAVDGKIGVELVDKRLGLVPPVKNVGTRRRFYRRERPQDGSPIDDIEWTLGEVEKMSAPVLRSLEDAWPLGGEDKLKIATLFAVQLLRGPRWMNEWKEGTQRFLDEYPDDPSIPEEELRAQEEALLGATNRLIHMLSMAPTMATILVSMHWTLLEFETDVIATSDHPVVVWPGLEARQPEVASLKVGVLECGEIRLPISPTRALLMTWVDNPDDEGTRARGTRDHAANLNAFTVASADQQWFHVPGRLPPVGAGSFRPLSPELVPGYTLTAAARSRRRATVSAAVQPKIGRDLHDQEVTMVTLSRPTREA